MSGLETVTSSVEDVLIDSLQFKPAPGASYLTAKRNTRWHASGSDTYSSNTGVRVILMSKVQCVLFFENCTTGGRGEKRGRGQLARSDTRTW